MRTLVLLAAMVLGLGASVAQATPMIDVTCYHNDCFKYGWMSNYPRAQFWAQTTCWKDDCTQYGWEVHDSRGMDTEVTCVGRGCFTDGWMESIGRQSQYYRCKSAEATNSNGTATPPSTNTSPDCWKYGFQADGPNVVSDADCINGSCRTNGWVTKVPGMPTANVICKTGTDETTGMTVNDCFKYGWSVYQ